MVRFFFSDGDSINLQIENYKEIFDDPELKTSSKLWWFNYKRKLRCVCLYSSSLNSLWLILCTPLLSFWPSAQQHAEGQNTRLNEQHPDISNTIIWKQKENEKYNPPAILKIILSSCFVIHPKTWLIFVQEKHGSLVHIKLPELYIHIYTNRMNDIEEC